MRQVKTILAIALLLTGVWSTAAQAELGFFTCEVKAAGKFSENAVFIRLTDTANEPAFTNKWFRAKAGIGNEMLAAALSALTADIPVSIHADPAEKGFPELNQLYLWKN